MTLSSDLVETAQSLVGYGKGILAIDIWQGNAANRTAAQAALRHRSRCSHAAIHGNYTEAQEAGPA